MTRQTHNRGSGRSTPADKKRAESGPDLNSLPPVHEFTGFEKEELSAFLRHAWTQDEFTPLRKRVIQKLEILVGGSWPLTLAKDSFAR